MSAPLSTEQIQEIVPGYETDLGAVGENRTVDPETVDDRPWYEVHGLTEADADDFLGENE